MLLLLVLVMVVAEPASWTSAPENSSPGDWIGEEQIKVYPDLIVLEVPGARWAGFTNTNSMDPLFDETAHALEIMPANPRDINVGDVISYQTPYGVMIHRVFKTGEDTEGYYYLVKGDNNPFPDPFKVRFEEVQGVVVAVVY